ncbi:MAG: hypothetical protein WAV15_02075 [Minisyncoccia bacterium]
MKDYSDKKINFSNLNLQRIITFLETIQKAQLPAVNYIAKKFQDAFIGFDDVLTFLVSVKIVKVENSQLNINRKISLDKKDLADFILRNLFENSFYRDSELETFLKYFSLKNGEYWFVRDQKVRLKTSGVRNFLIDLGFLIYDKETNSYLISHTGFENIDW